MLKEKSRQLRILYRLKLYFKNEDEINPFPDKQNWEKLLADSFYNTKWSSSGWNQMTLQKYESTGTNNIDNYVMINAYFSSLILKSNFK